MTHWSTAKHGRTAHAWVPDREVGWITQVALCAKGIDPYRFQINSIGPIDAPKCRKCERLLTTQPKG